jgi:C-terminal processing protease CtpA/Prc
MRHHLLLTFLLLCGLERPCQAQLGPLDRGRARDMLAVLHNDVRKYYYDPGFRGINLDQEFQHADSMLDRAQSIPQLFGVIAKVLLQFQDSHTIFLPPSQTIRVRYGWELRMLGDSCFVTGITPASDAAVQSLRIGDRVITIQGVPPTRQLLNVLDYLLYSLSPVDVIQFRVESPDGQIRDLEVASKVLPDQQLIDLTVSTDVWAIIRGIDDDVEMRRNRFVEVDSATLVWHLPGFDSNDGIDEGIGRARHHANLVLDLRGNRGGGSRVLLRLLGRLLERETVVDTLRLRDKVEVEIVRPDERRFAGKLIVLVDSRSASAAEMLARVVQLEARGTVIGDRSAGAVMMSRLHVHRIGTQIIVPYAASITEGDVIMRDGSRLEGIGVSPDVLVVASGQDLSVGRDPVFGEALRRLGYPVGPGGVTSPFPALALEMENW